MDRSDLQQAAPTPRTAPLPPAAQAALQRAEARYKVASTTITKATHTAGTRDLTPTETADLNYLHTVVDAACATLTAQPRQVAGR